MASWIPSLIENGRVVSTDGRIRFSRDDPLQTVSRSRQSSAVECLKQVQTFAGVLLLRVLCANVSGLFRLSIDFDKFDFSSLPIVAGIMSPEQFTLV